MKISELSLEICKLICNYSNSRVGARALRARVQDEWHMCLCHEQGAGACQLVMNFKIHTTVPARYCVFISLES